MISWIMAVALALPAAPWPSRMPTPCPRTDHGRASGIAGTAARRNRRGSSLAERASAAAGRIHVRAARPEHGLPGDATYTVEQTYATREANCLSFTLLFLALAREAGLDAYPQVIEETLGWDQRDSTIYRNIHINAGVRIAGQRFTVDVASDSVIARHHPAPVSTSGCWRFTTTTRPSSFGAEPGQAGPRLHGRSDRSRSGLCRPLEQCRRDLPAQRRSSGSRTRLYPCADAGPRACGGVIQHGRSVRAHRRPQARSRIPPATGTGAAEGSFHHFLLAIDFEKNGDYRRAVEHYQRAIRLYPDEHRFYFALAKAYVQLGDVRRASRALLRAQAHSDGATRDLYQAKLESLRKPPAPAGIAQ